MIPNKIIVYGVNLYNTLGLIRSLGERGIGVILMLEPCEKSHRFVDRSKYISKVHYLDTSEQVIDVLKAEYWHEEYKPIILCGGDKSVCILDAHYDELKDHVFMFNAGGRGRINHFMDKINTFPLAEEAGFDIIRTWSINDSELLPKDVSFPCIVKGENSTTSTKADLTICNNYDELCSFLKADTNYLIQEYIDKDYEIDVVGVAYNQGKDVYVPAVVRKIRDEIHRQSVYIRLDDIAKYPNLNVDAIRHFVSKIGYDGIFSVELMCKENKLYFLEVNMRNDACGYLYTSAGCNYPYLWVKYCVGKLDDNDLKKQMPRTPFTLMSEGDFANLIEGKVNILMWLHQALTVDAHFIFNKKDLKPFLRLWFVHFRQMCKKIFRINN